MTQPLSQFPRRHAHRQALHHGRGGTPPPDSPSQKCPKYEPRVKKKRRSGSYSDVDDSSSDFGSDSERDHDSGYNYESDTEAKANYYRQKIAEFKEAGPTLLNLSESAGCDGDKRAERGIVSLCHIRQ
jgi:hypothetical protein